MADITANMTGTVIEILVNVADSVDEGQDIITLESMKMHINLPSTAGGTVKEIKVKPGDTVKTNDVLMVLE